MGGSLMHLMLRLKGMRRFCLYIAQIVPPARRGALKDTPRHRGQHPGHGPVRQHFGKGRFRTPQKLATMGTVVTDAAPPLLCPGLFSIFLSRLCLPLSPHPFFTRLLLLQRSQKTLIQSPVSVSWIRDDWMTD
jgi:hypothetical protein